MTALKESLAKAVQNERATAEAFQALERVRLLSLHKGFYGRVSVELEVEDGVITHVYERYDRSVV